MQPAPACINLARNPHPSKFEVPSADPLHPKQSTGCSGCIFRSFNRSLAAQHIGLEFLLRYEGWGPAILSVTSWASLQSGGLTEGWCQHQKPKTILLFARPVPYSLLVWLRRCHKDLCSKFAVLERRRLQFSLNQSKRKLKRSSRQSITGLRVPKSAWDGRSLSSSKV